MTIESGLSMDGTELTIAVKGKFDFKLLNDFRQTYTDGDFKNTIIVLDMRATTSIDSSALGMLLNMQRHLEKKDGDISIINCKPEVKKVFQISLFDKKFTID